MRRTLLALTIIATSGMSLAHHDEPGKGDEKVKVLSVIDAAERFDGKKTKATSVEVTLGPGKSGVPHRHPGPAFGYVLEGEYEWAIDDNMAKVLKVGDTFYEPAGCLHRVSRNPSKKGDTRILAIVLHPADAKDLVIPEKAK